MPAPAAIRLWSCAFAVDAMACPGTARAQYAGGLGDGYSTVGLANLRLDGGLSISPAYFASTSGGDGYAVAGRGNVALNGSTLPVAVFTSSAAGGDGYDTAGRISQSLNGTSLPVAVFTSSTA